MKIFKKLYTCPACEAQTRVFTHGKGATRIKRPCLGSAHESWCRYRGPATPEVDEELYLMRAALLSRGHS